MEFYAKSDSKQTITIFNDYGAVRSSQLINGVITNYDISEEPKGMYYLKVTSDDKSYFLKYLKL
ncbi:MAG: T9SS type A sorting domain-containing protein [Saprospiraceae bacterium]|nr:T9SS type A sorting domain-containing protein [Saprospiraceae bacterium]